MDLSPNTLTGEYIRAAWIVMNREGRPLHPKEIVDFARRDSILSDKLAGKTPHFTLHAQLCMHIKKYGENSIFVRTAPGVFYLRSKTEHSVAANPTKTLKNSEQVLTFEASLLDELARFQGINADWKSFYKLLLDNSSKRRYQNRLTAETADGWKQVLTYIIVTKGNKVLTFQRGAYNRTEDYLRGCACIGFGGHVTWQDHSLFDELGIIENAKRELSEELALPDKDKARLEMAESLEYLGVLNDDSSSVGQKHFAFIFKYEVSDDPYWEAPKKGEQSINQPHWLDSSLTGKTPIWIYEYWSQLCLGTYFPELVMTIPAYKIVNKKKLRTPHVLCIVGAIGSGKSEATNILKRDFKYIEINTGLLVAELIGIPPVPETPREEFCRNSLAFISSPEGPDQLANAIEQKIKTANSERILVDGIRHKKTLYALRQRLVDKPLVVMCITTLPHIAYQFYREREAGEISVFDFLRIRQLEVESEVGSLLEDSDVILYNSMGIEQYTKMISEVVNNLGLL